MQLGQVKWQRSVGDDFLRGMEVEKLTEGDGVGGVEGWGVNKKQLVCIRWGNKKMMASEHGHFNE
jgi:hypothetical protein